MPLQMQTPLQLPAQMQVPLQIKIPWQRQRPLHMQIPLQRQVPLQMKILLQLALHTYRYAKLFLFQDFVTCIQALCPPEPSSPSSPPSPPALSHRRKSVSIASVIWPEESTKTCSCTKDEGQELGSHLPFVTIIRDARPCYKRDSLCKNQMASLRRG